MNAFFRWRQERKIKKAYGNYYGKKNPNRKIWIFLVILAVAIALAGVLY
jgi:hypothetical protein